MTARRALSASLCSGLLLVLAWGCSAADRNNDGGSSGAAGNMVTEGGNDEQVVKPDGSSADDAGLDLNPLCGPRPTCVPDEPSACAAYQPPETNPSGGASGVDGAGAGGASGAAGSSEGGMAGMDSSEGGASGSAGEAGAAGQAGAGGPQVPPSSYSCQVQRTPNGNGVAAQCAIAGPGGVGSPCLTSADCQGGDLKGRGALGCVGDSSSGLCLPYCCQGNDSCGAGTYCAERPMRDASTKLGAEQLSIPVCVPAENCDLSSPYPCPEGTECACKSGTACLVVRSDGTTTCAAPGKGQVGDACPCAWGHVCSAVTNQCLKLCYTRNTADCGSGKCQAASELPVGWGVCVGG